MLLAMSGGVAGSLSGCAGPTAGHGATHARVHRDPRRPGPADRPGPVGRRRSRCQDRRYVARYTLAPANRPPSRAAAGSGGGTGSGRNATTVTVTVAVATDGSWVVAIPGGALGGLADVAVFHGRAGDFQCTLGPAAGTAGTRPDLGPLTPGCVLVSRLGASTDPQVQHIFTDWIDPLVDRATALSVTVAAALPGSRGTCYSVESTSAALAPPVDPGIYCYEPDGVLTAARVGFGTLTLAGAGRRGTTLGHHARTGGGPPAAGHHGAAGTTARTGFDAQILTVGLSHLSIFVVYPYHETRRVPSPPSEHRGVHCSHHVAGGFSFVAATRPHQAGTSSRCRCARTPKPRLAAPPAGPPQAPIRPHRWDRAHHMVT